MKEMQAVVAKFGNLLERLDKKQDEISGRLKIGLETHERKLKDLQDGKQKAEKSDPQTAFAIPNPWRLAAEANHPEGIFAGEAVHRAEPLPQRERSSGQDS